MTNQGLQQLRDYFKNAAIIAIAQSTKDGKMSGSNEIIHDCDIEVSVYKGIACTVKNRFYKTETEYCIFDEEKEEIRKAPVVKLPKNIIEQRWLNRKIGLFLSFVKKKRKQHYDQNIKHLI